MKTMKASEFKAKCLQAVDEVAETGEGVVITKKAKPVVELVPARKRPQELFGSMKGSIKILGDIIEPIDVEREADR